MENEKTPTKQQPEWTDERLERVAKLKGEASLREFVRLLVDLGREESHAPVSQD